MRGTCVHVYLCVCVFFLLILSVEKTATGGPVKNKDLWVSLDEARDALAQAGVRLDVQWIKGHGE